MAYRDIIRALVLLSLVTVIAAQFTVQPQYRFVSRTRRSWRIELRCYTRYTCYGPRRVCYRKCVYFTEVYYERVCQEGYRGTTCNIPICANCDANNGICAARDRCICTNGFSGADCRTETCSSRTDCYPGVCNSRTVRCQCSSGFEGDNCQLMKEGPILQGTCAGRLYFEGAEVATADCDRDSNNTVITYTNARDFDTLEVEYDYTYTPDGDRPSVPPQGYLQAFRVGIVDTHMVIRQLGGNGQTLSTNNSVCDDYRNIDRSFPFASTPCRKEIPYSSNNFGFRHNQSLDVELVGETGGVKQIRDDAGNGRIITRGITGERDSLHLTFNFDLVSPVHCTESDTCGDEAEELPLATVEDITRNRSVELLFLGWDDDLSEVREYRYSVYRLEASADGDLNHRRDPFTTGDYNNFEDNRTNPEYERVDSGTFALPESGLFSIIGEVHDWAGNIRYARALVLYADQQNRITTTAQDWTVASSVNVIGRTFWVTSPTANLNISWDGCFINTMLTDGQFLRPLRQLDASYGEYLDYSPTRGNISTDGTDNQLGITSFRYSIESLPTNISANPEVPEDFKVMGDNLTSHYLLTGRSIGNRQQVTFWVQAVDPFGNELNDYRYIMTDTTPPSIGNTSGLVKNVERQGMRGFFSGVNVEISDLEGGIFRIDSSLFDNTQPLNQRLIGNATQMAQVVNKAPDQCTGRSTDCVCATSSDNQCYRSPQMIYIDNCVFTEYTTVNVVLKLTVFNRALRTMEKVLEFPPVGELDGIETYPPVEDYRVVRAFAYRVRVTWYLPVACYPIFKVMISTTYDGAEEGEIPDIVISQGVVEAEIPDLIPNTEYTSEIFIIYENRQESERVPLTFVTGEDRTLPPKGLSVGAIVGIVIAVLLVIAILVVVILIVVRIKRKQPPLPQRVVSVKNNIQQRFSRRFGHSVRDPPPPYSVGGGGGGAMTMNVAYVSGPKLRDFEDDIYTYGEMETDPSATWKHSNDEVKVGKVIQSGRFAEIREGMMRDSTGTRKVAVKILRDHSEEDELLMKAKMNFLATCVPNHNNIVNFVGAITEGPIILLEYCDMPLKEWLKGLSKITMEQEEDMTNFCTDVARAMQHLHDHEIVHRRLGARNVLLKDIPLMGRLVAKVTGFGPMKGEQKGNTVDNEKEKIPIKWMALEQIGLKDAKKKRPYNEKTDVWSYGILVWEIYSRGAAPWSQNKHGEIKGLLESGVRPPCPNDCTPELYDQVMMQCWQKNASKRPKFSDLRGTLEKLFHGAPDGDEYYGDQEDVADAFELYDETIPSKGKYY